MKEKLLTIRDASQYLGITEAQVVDLAQRGIIPAYKVGGVYLRFSPAQLESVKDKIQPTQIEAAIPYSTQEKVRDFLYYNDFYIASLIIIGILIYFIVAL